MGSKSRIGGSVFGILPGPWEVPGFSDCIWKLPELAVAPSHHFLEAILCQGHSQESAALLWGFGCCGPCIAAVRTTSDCRCSHTGQQSQTLDRNHLENCA